MKRERDKMQSPPRRTAKDLFSHMVNEATYKYNESILAVKIFFIINLFKSFNWLN